MNTYSKFAANVFVAKCTDTHAKGEIIELETKYGKIHECIIFNLVGRSNDGSFLYSIVRADGYNIQERAKAKPKDTSNGLRVPKKRAMHFGRLQMRAGIF